MPSPRETILQANFDPVTRAMLLAVFDDVWSTCEDRSDMNGYRLAGCIIDIAQGGQRSKEAIHRYAAHNADCRL
jgi:hypothetical protein